MAAQMPWTRGLPEQALWLSTAFAPDGRERLLPRAKAATV